MKIYASRKSIKDGFPRILSVGYCELQNLLQYTPQPYYNRGQYGWNFNVYVVYDEYGNADTAITTGYRGTIGHRPSGELIKQYEQLAQKYISIRNSNDRVAKINELRDEFIKNAFAETEENK